MPFVVLAVSVFKYKLQDTLMANKVTDDLDRHIMPVST